MNLISNIKKIFSPSIGLDARQANMAPIQNLTEGESHAVPGGPQVQNDPQKPP
ncbi:hypothetical protein ACEN9F_31620 [Duganella sp. CT11-25]|uniref:hypothetical protein n=1 Tax=unclassified Duganella TaxID=2636909 RepID=UPI0039B0E052